MKTLSIFPKSISMALFAVKIRDYFSSTFFAKKKASFTIHDKENPKISYIGLFI